MVSREQYNESWIARWPGYCRACGGWGGSTIWQNHGDGGRSEPIFDVCEAINFTRCHRCGVPGTLSVDSEGPCKNCTWNFDDGLLDADESEVELDKYLDSIGIKV